MRLTGSYHPGCTRWEGRLRRGVGFYLYLDFHIYESYSIYESMANALLEADLGRIPAVLAQLLDLPVKEASLPRGIESPRGMDLVLAAGSHSFLVEYKETGTLASMAVAVAHAQEVAKHLRAKAIPLVATRYMGRAAADFCERAGVSWLDLSGNAHIVASGIKIHVQGLPDQFKRAGRPPSLFTPRSSRIARVLLSDPKLRFLSQRELSKRADLSEGSTSRIVHGLEAQSLVEREASGKVRASDPNLLLDAWHEAYDFSRHHLMEGHIAARTSDDLIREVAKTLKKQKMDYALTGLGAAWALTHHAGFRLVTLFLQGVPKQDLLGALHFREESRGANTWLVVPNDDAVFAGKAEIDGVSYASPLQVYLDLKGHPERAKEAAQELRKTRLQWSKNG